MGFHQTVPARVNDSATALRSMQLYYPITYGQPEAGSIIRTLGKKLYHLDAQIPAKIMEGHKKTGTSN